MWFLPKEEKVADEVMWYQISVVDSGWSSDLSAVDSSKSLLSVVDRRWSIVLSAADSRWSSVLSAVDSGWSSIHSAVDSRWKSVLVLSAVDINTIVYYQQ